jgi:FG-GAP repeat
VRVFNGKTLASLSSFFAYAPSFTGGVRVATGDVNGDGTPDLITGAGPGSAPAVRVFDGATSTLLHSFNAFDAGFTGGVYPAGANEPTGAGLSSSSFPLIGGGTTLNPSCPAGMPGGFCSGRITLLLPAVQKIRGVTAAARKKAKPVVLGSAKFKVAAGKKGKARIALSKRALKALGRAKKVKAIARLVTRDAGGNASTRQKAIVLTRHT